MSEQIETLTVAGVQFATMPGMARVRTPAGDLIDLTAGDLGEIAEFLAEAWFNLEGEDYEQGLEHYLRSVGHPFAERDCE